MTLNYMTTKESDMINNMNPASQNRLLGSRIKYLLDTVQGGIGNVFYLSPENGNDTNDGKSPSTAFASLTTAYAALTDNNNDVLVYIATLNGKISLTTGFTWAKNFTHFVGMCGPTVNARARIYQLATATGITSLFTISGSGCMFKNIQIMQGVADATSLVAVTVTGQRNYFDGCHFAGIGHATQDAAGAASLVLDGGSASNGENTFKDCYIGLDTIASGANGTEIILKNKACRNAFIGCVIYRQISAVTHRMVTVAANDIDRFVIFKDCIFETDSVNQAFTIGAIFSVAASVQGKIILKDCMMLTDGVSGSGVWSTGATGIIFTNMIAPTAAGAGGISTKL